MCDVLKFSFNYHLNYCLFLDFPLQFHSSRYCSEMELKNTKSSKSLPESNRLFQLPVLHVICCCFCCLIIFFCCLITFLFTILNEKYIYFQKLWVVQNKSIYVSSESIKLDKHLSFSNICVNQARSLSLPA